VVFSLLMVTEISGTAFFLSYDKVNVGALPPEVYEVFFFFLFGGSPRRSSSALLHNTGPPLVVFFFSLRWVPLRVSKAHTMLSVSPPLEGVPALPFGELIEALPPDTRLIALVFLFPYQTLPARYRVFFFP